LVQHIWTLFYDPRYQCQARASCNSVDLFKGLIDWEEEDRVEGDPQSTLEAMRERIKVLENQTTEVKCIVDDLFSVINEEI